MTDGGTQGIEFGTALAQLWYVWVIGIIAAALTLFLGTNDQVFPDTYAEVFYAFILAVFTIGVFGYGVLKMREKTRKYRI